MGCCASRIKDTKDQDKKKEMDELYEHFLRQSKRMNVEANLRINANAQKNMKVIINKVILNKI